MKFSGEFCLPAYVVKFLVSSFWPKIFEAFLEPIGQKADFAPKNRRVVRNGRTEADQIHFGAGLPDFARHNIPKRESIPNYQKL
jgi:hypothetical protein